MHAIAFALAAPLIVAACAAVGGPESPGTSPTPSQTPSPAPLDNGTVPAELFATIVDDAAGRAGVDQSAFTVIQASTVTWSDGSLGCPEPGQFYTMALVPGYRVILEAGGVTYDYHASQRGGFSLCPAGRAKDPVEGGDAL